MFAIRFSRDYQTFSNLFHQETVVVVVLKQVQINPAVSEYCCREWINALPGQHL